MLLFALEFGIRRVLGFLCLLIFGVGGTYLRRLDRAGCLDRRVDFLDVSIGNFAILGIEIAFFVLLVLFASKILADLHKTNVADVYKSESPPVFYVLGRVFTENQLMVLVPYGSIIGVGLLASTFYVSILLIHFSNCG